MWNQRRISSRHRNLSGVISTDHLLIAIRSVYPSTFRIWKNMYVEHTESSSTPAPKQSCWKSKANFHFTARQLPDTQQMNAAANKSIKSCIKTTTMPPPPLPPLTNGRIGRGKTGGGDDTKMMGVGGHFESADLGKSFMSAGVKPSLPS